MKKSYRGTTNHDTLIPSSCIQGATTTPPRAHSHCRTDTATLMLHADATDTGTAISTVAKTLFMLYNQPNPAERRPRHSTDSDYVGAAAEMHAPAGIVCSRCSVALLQHFRVCSCMDNPPHGGCSRFAKLDPLSASIHDHPCCDFTLSLFRSHTLHIESMPVQFNANKKRKALKHV